MAWIKIGAITYMIEKVSTLRDEDGAELNGSINYSKARIKVRKGLDAQIVQVVMWHETLHAILIQAGLSGLDERAIEALAYGICGVLEDNRSMRRRSV